MATLDTDEIIARSVDDILVSCISFRWTAASSLQGQGRGRRRRLLLLGAAIYKSNDVTRRAVIGRQRLINIPRGLCA